MKCRGIAAWWKGLFKKVPENHAPTEGSGARIRVSPLTMGMRVEVSLSSDGNIEARGSHFIWLSPAASRGPGKSLEILLSPN